MKKYLTMLVAVLAVVAITMPAFAFEVSWGGVFRARILSDNYFTSYDNPNIGDNVPAEFVRPGKASDHYNRVDQRARLYMYIVASENLRVVNRFEIGDITWGDVGSGGRVGADQRNVEVKNSYVEFNIPCTPVSATVGVQGIALLNSWLIDNDYSAAVLRAKLDPVNIQLGYIGAQNTDVYTQNSNIDDIYLNVDYTYGPFAATLVGFYQYAHDTAASVDPAGQTVPLSGIPAQPVTGAFNGQSFVPSGLEATNNNLFDIGLNLGYKMDWMNVYLNFIKNFGSVDLAAGNDSTSVDYKGWMVDAGANMFYGPFTFTVKGFYTSGPDLEKDPNSPNYGQTAINSNVDWFVMPYNATSVYFSEIMGGGILDAQAPNHEDFQWTAYGGAPMNLWTISVGAAWQALPTTKLSASYWYFGNANDVIAGFNQDGTIQWDNSVGNEFDLYLTQDIVDGLKLDLVAAYMISGDSYSMYSDDPNPYELGARLQWAF